MTDADDLRRLVEPQCHEYAANYNYNEHGLRSWFACDRVVKDGDGSVKAEFSFLGQTWEVTLYYQESAILPPAGGVTPAGTEVRQDSIREFRLAVEALDDTRQQKANFHLRPRWDEMEAETDDGQRTEIPVPDALANYQTDAVNVRINGSNIDFHEYDALLQAAAEAVGVSGHYFARDTLHRTSNIQDAAMYLRIHRDVSGPIHARTGPLVGLAHVLENDREGYRKLVQNDTDEQGRRVPGYYHTVTLGPDRVREVMPDHRLPVECKHYYAKDAFGRADNDPLAHPKLEVAYQVSRWDGTLRPDDLDELGTELEEFLYAILSDAGLDLRAGGRTYVEDAYFDAENGTTTASVVDLDLTEVRHEQESVVYSALADGMSPVEQETLQKLVTDGGEVSPADIADDTGRHQDSVYAALQRMHDLVEHEYGAVSLKSTYVSELVADALDRAQDAVTDATLAAAKAVNAAERGLDETTSAFVAWTEKYGVNYQDGDDRLKIDVGEVSSTDEVRRILREGYRLWGAMGRDDATFRGAEVRYSKPGESADLNYLASDRSRRRVHTDAFRLLG